MANEPFKIKTKLIEYTLNQFSERVDEITYINICRKNKIVGT